MAFKKIEFIFGNFFMVTGPYLLPKVNNFCFFHFRKKVRTGHLKYLYLRDRKLFSLSEEGREQVA